MRGLSSIAAAVVVSVMAAGCTLAPTYTRPAAPVPQTFRTDGVYGSRPVAAANERSAEGVAAVETGWRDFFADARLQRLIGIALNNNCDLRVAVLNLHAAQAQYRVARSALMPGIDASARETKTRTPKDLALFNQTIANQYNVGLNGAWEIDLFGRVQSLRDHALAHMLTRQRRSRWCRSICRCWRRTICSRSPCRRSAPRRTHTSWSRQFDNGVASELDLMQSQTAVETAQANLQSQ